MNSNSNSNSNSKSQFITTAMTDLRILSLLPIVVALIALVASSLTTDAFTTERRPLSSGWSVVPKGRLLPQQQQQQQHRQQQPSKLNSNFPTSSTTSTTTTTTTRLNVETSETEQEKDDRISETDARVLQSMLRDNKLDLEQTSNMKKLLERGIRKDNEDEDEDEEDGDDKATEKPKKEETYSSEVIKTLADTKFWKAFKRNAGELLESVAISVTNEIEKGAKVLVGLGFFAWDRAKQDVARALPTAATVPKKKVFQLGETSSFVEPAAEEEESVAAAEEEMTPSQRAKSIRQEFTTPADEISAVTAEISKIFQRADRQVAERAAVDKSRDTRNPFFAAFAEERKYQLESGEQGSTPFYASASLSTTASRGSSRLDSAFARSQKTKLAREKENIAVKGNRLVAGAIDSAYQVKAEIASEQNVPGYKTKQLRDTTVDVSRQLAGAAKKTAGFLGGAKNFLLGESTPEEASAPQRLPQAGSTDAAAANANTNAGGGGGGKAEANPVDFLDESSYFAFKREVQPPVPEGGLASPDPSTATETEDLSGGIIIEDNRIINTEDDDSGGGPFGFLSAIAKRGRGKQTAPSPETSSEAAAAAAAAAQSRKQQPEVMEVITDAEVVMDNKDNFNFYDAKGDSKNSGNGKDYFTTNEYLENMETGSAAATRVSAGAAAFDDDGLRQVTAEVITDDNFDETVFAQATTVDNLSAEELLRQQAAQEAEENAEPNFVTKATLRALDVVFLVVEKGAGVAPLALEVVQRAATRATEGKIKDSAGSQIGWELHNGNIRGDKRY